MFLQIVYVYVDVYRYVAVNEKMFVFPYVSD